MRSLRSGSGVRTASRRHLGPKRGLPPCPLPPDYWLSLATLYNSGYRSVGPDCILFPPPIQTTGATGENLVMTDSWAQQTRRDCSWTARHRDYQNTQGWSVHVSISGVPAFDGRRQRMKIAVDNRNHRNTEVSLPTRVLWSHCSLLLDVKWV